MHTNVRFKGKGFIDCRMPTALAALHRNISTTDLAVNMNGRQHHYWQHDDQAETDRENTDDECGKPANQGEQQQHWVVAQRVLETSLNSASCSVVTISCVVHPVGVQRIDEEQQQVDDEEHA